MVTVEENMKGDELVVEKPMKFKVSAPCIDWSEA